MANGAKQRRRWRQRWRLVAAIEVVDITAAAGSPDARLVLEAEAVRVGLQLHASLQGARTRDCWGGKFTSRATLEEAFKDIGQPLPGRVLDTWAQAAENGTPYAIVHVVEVRR